MKTLMLFLVGCFLSWNIAAQSLPKVFMLGEHEEAFEKLSAEHSDMLLTVCGDDMKLAYEKWQDVLMGMEAHATEMEYDLKGSKMWFNIFWGANGKIKHIAYYLKPNSRNLDLDELQLFLISFMNQYIMPLSYNKPFSHYGSAAFPMVPIRAQKKDAKKEDKELARENNGSNGND